MYSNSDVMAFVAKKEKKWYKYIPPRLIIALFLSVVIALMYLMSVIF